MAGITLTQAEDQLAVWLAADTAVAGGQQYSIGSRALTRANAKEIRENITYWNGWVQRLQNSDSGGMRIRGGTPT